MKIDDKIISYEINQYIPKSTQDVTEKVAKKQLSDEQKVGEENRSEQDAVVNLSRASKEAQLIKEIISSEPDVREDKVSALRERIESGNYIIDHEAVAGKIVDASIDEILHS